MKVTPYTRRPILTGAIVAAALVLSSCGGGDSPAEGTQQVSVNAIPGMFFASLPAIGDSAGIYEKNGLQLEFLNAKDSPSIASAIAANSADFGVLPPAQAVPAMNQGAKMKVILNNYSIDASLVGKPDLKADGGVVDQMEALRGKRIGVTARGTLSESFVTRMLGEAGLTDNDVTYIAVGSGQSATAAFENDQVDAVVLFAPAVSFLEEGSFDTLVDTATSANEVYGGDLLYTTWAASADMTSDAPETVDAFCRATRETMEYAADPANKADVTSFLMGYMNVDEQVAVDTYDTYIGNFDADLDEAVWNAQEAFLGGEPLPAYPDAVVSGCGQ